MIKRHKHADLMMQWLFEPLEVSSAYHDFTFILNDMKTL